MQGSEAHAHQLAFYLLSKKAPEESQALEKGEIDFLEEIRKDHREMEAANTEVERCGVTPDVEEDDERPRKVAKRQTAYDFFREMRQVGLKPTGESPSKG